MDDARPIDKIDRRILRVLQADGRISNLKLAEAVHLSPTAVLERVRRLHRDGYILGYEARLNPAKLGAGLLVAIPSLMFHRYFRTRVEYFQLTMELAADTVPEARAPAELGSLDTMIAGGGGPWAWSRPWPGGRVTCRACCACAGIRKRPSRP